MNETLKLLAVFPHPDDETLGMGGTLAAYAAEGIETYLVCATRGERGWSGPAGENPGLDGLGRIREQELRCAAAHLGLRDVAFLDYIDGDVDQADPHILIARLSAEIRRVRPQVVVTFAPEGNYGHPDHIALAQATCAAVVAAADAGFLERAGRGPHRVSKLYYLVDSLRLVEQLRALIGGIRMTIDGVERSHVGWEDWAITTRIDCSAVFDRVLSAARCHQSQLAGFGPLFDLPRETLLDLFGEGTFVRAFSFVNGGRETETDLFAGLRPTAR